LTALAAVVLVQGALIVALVSGLRVHVDRSRDSVERLIDIALAQPPPVPPPPERPLPREHRAEAAPKAPAAPIGGSPGPQPAHAAPVPTPILALRPSAPAAGGGTGSGLAVGSGSGGSTGGNGQNASDDSGTESEQIAGEILPSDYPKGLGKAGIGGHVGIDFTVGVTGRVTRCRVTRSSGVPQLDDLTCRLIVERFRFRPATDAAGRPVEDEIEGVHIWSVTGGY
jgi:protein TonB